MPTRDPGAAWTRYKDKDAPLHALTEIIARAIHEENHPDSKWDIAKEGDTWLAVGSWMAAERVVQALSYGGKVAFYVHP